MGYLNQEEGLYPHSYDKGEYNGHDLLECVQIDPKPGLHRMTEADGTPKKLLNIQKSLNSQMINMLM